ncbi:hypothetical protein APHAL10511_003232 [Amanita phalloides]|nr:hypothetical protein APHAL10511_008123 [Amanita phalloides]KAK2464814.1 hypothetical protein APHAL10511_003232 [Amanita phalloides]
MLMRYFGGGVGHASTREATNLFLSDRHGEALEDAENSAENGEEEPEPVPMSYEEPDAEEIYDYDSDRPSESEGEDNEVEEGNRKDEDECGEDRESDEEHDEL